MMMQKKVIWIIAVSTIIRLLIAATTELGNDEVYYYTYALHLQYNYFDHPPGVALLIRLSTLNLLLTNELFVRLGAIFCAAAGTWLSYKIGCCIKNERTGWYASILYTTSIYTSIIAGTFILPDSPQLIFWMATLFVMIKMIKKLTVNSSPAILQWLLFSLLSGCCILCKVHGIFLWVGFLLYLLLYKRTLFFQPWLYLSFLATLLIVSPVIWWNVNNHFITYIYHSKRVEVSGFHINSSTFFQALTGQFLYNNPVNVAAVISACYMSKKKNYIQVNIFKILLLTGLPIIIIVSFLSLFNTVLPHWSGPGFATLFFAAAAYLDKIYNDNLTMPIVLKRSIVLISIVIAGGVMLIHFYPGTLSFKTGKDYGSGDFTLDLYGWKNIEQQYNKWWQQNGNEPYRHLGFVCDKWFPAAHIEYYIAKPLHTHVTGVGNLNDLHNFAWLNQSGNDLHEGDSALCLVPSNYSINVNNVFRNTFSGTSRLKNFIVYRNGKEAKFFTLYLLTDYKATDEVHSMQFR